MLALAWSSGSRTGPPLPGTVPISSLGCTLGLVHLEGHFTIGSCRLGLAHLLSPGLASQQSIWGRDWTKPVPLPLCCHFSSCLGNYPPVSHNGRSKGRRRRKTSGLLGAPLLALLFVQGKEHPRWDRKGTTGTMGA